MTKSMRMRTCLSLLAIAVLSLGGCGGSDSDGGDVAAGDASGEATGASSKARFVEAANAACAKSQRQMKAQIQAYAKQAAEGSTKQVARLAVERVIRPGFEEQIREIRSLEPPPEDAEQVEEILTTTEAVLERARANPFEFVETNENPFERAEYLATKYGLTACARL